MSPYVEGGNDDLLEDMKKQYSIAYGGLALLMALGISSCTTTYDAYGRPVQSVDPAAVAVGAVVLGAAAYSAGQHNSYNNNYNRHGGHHRPHHRRGHR